MLEMLGVAVFPEWRVEVRSHEAPFFGRCQDFGNVNCPNASTLAMEGAADMHEAGVVRCRANLGTSIQDTAHFIAEYCQRGIYIFERKGATEATAFLCTRQFNEVNTAHCSQ